MRKAKVSLKRGAAPLEKRVRKGMGAEPRATAAKLTHAVVRAKRPPLPFACLFRCCPSLLPLLTPFTC